MLTTYTDILLCKNIYIRNPMICHYTSFPTYECTIFFLFGKINHLFKIKSIVNIKTREKGRYEI